MPDWTRPIIHPITGQRAPAFLHGVIVPMFTPCNEDHSLDERGIRAYTEYLIGTRAVTTLFPRSGLGRMYSFQFDEAKRLTDIVLDQAAGRIPVMPGCAGIIASERRVRPDAEVYTQQSIELAQHAAQRGAVAVVLPTPSMIIPRETSYGEAGGPRSQRPSGGPSEVAGPDIPRGGASESGRPSGYTRESSQTSPDYERSMDTIVGYYRRVAAETNLPIVIYQPPGGFRDFSMTPQVLGRVLEIPRIVGIKYSTDRMSIFLRLADVVAGKDFTLVAGDETVFPFVFMLGGAGVIGQGCSINPEVLRAEYERLMSSDYAGAARASTDVFRAVQAAQSIDASILGLMYLGRKGVNVQPYSMMESQTQDATTEQVDEAARKIDAIRQPYLVNRWWSGAGS